MNHSEFASKVLEAVQRRPESTPKIEMNEQRLQNAGRTMIELLCNRLRQTGNTPSRLRRTTFEWQSGIVAIRNARIVDHHWSSLSQGTLDQLHEEGAKRPVVQLLTYWAMEEGTLHLWALPEDLTYQPMLELPKGEKTGQRTVEIFPGHHRIANSEHSPDFREFYARVELTDEEVDKTSEAIKLDQAIKQAGNEQKLDSSEDEDEELTTARYTSSTVSFIKDLTDHTEDSEWHEENKARYQKVLRDPTRDLVEQIRSKYVEKLSPEVAGGKRHLSILKKNDYGKGGYHDHYWFAFYDPLAGSKTKSVQLFFRILGAEQVWRYGFAMGNYCGDYLARLHEALLGNRKAAADYLRTAPDETLVRIGSNDAISTISASELADRLDSSIGESADFFGGTTRIDVVREHSLDSMLDHVDGLVDEVGEFFTWAWPFFDASLTGKWTRTSAATLTTSPGEDLEGDVDEDAPASLDALSELTSLPIQLLRDLEDALLAKQQAVLVGPPGTSKTFIARQFARYFVRQRPGHLQGSYHTLYMHVNWTYEDFFEGIKPISKDGELSFEPKKGFFLEWVTEALKGFDSTARHVLVLDEINRCDTAAVLGELLQLLEYRGTTIRLLSGRQFVFPKNLFIIGTMNSADRSIGRMDLALRRRFLWLDLHPQPHALKAWLGRPGNNPVGFDAVALEKCNDLISQRGISPEQHIGHALFMLQQAEADDDTPVDSPLTEKQLRRIVKFSVLPYLRELFATQFGQVDQEVIRLAEKTLLSCLTGKEQEGTP